MKKLFLFYGYVTRPRRMLHCILIIMSKPQIYVSTNDELERSGFHEVLPVFSIVSVFPSELRPRLRGWRSASRVRSHVWRGRPGGRLQSLGSPRIDTLSALVMSSDVSILATRHVASRFTGALVSVSMCSRPYVFSSVLFVAPCTVQQLNFSLLQTTGQWP